MGRGFALRGVAFAVVILVLGVLASLWISDRSKPSLTSVPGSMALPVAGSGAPVSDRAWTIKVGISDLDYPPFYFEDAGGMRGAAYEIAAEVARQQGYRFEIERRPWKRIQAGLKTGEIEMMILYFKTPERADDVIYAEFPHIYEASALFVESSSSIAFTGDLGALRAYRFGSVRGYSHGEVYDHSTVLSKQEVNNEQQLIRVLVNGRVDVAVCNPQAIRFYAKQMGMEERIRFLEPAVAVEPNYLAFSKARPNATKLAKAFSDGLREFMRTPRYRRILNEYELDAEVSSKEFDDGGVAPQQ